MEEQTASHPLSHSPAGEGKKEQVRVRVGVRVRLLVAVVIIIIFLVKTGTIRKLQLCVP